MAIYKKITDLIGNTPLVELGNIEEAKGLQATLLAKVEFSTPAEALRTGSLRR